MTVDVLIAGASTTGLALAFELRRLDPSLSVMVVDETELPGRGVERGFPVLLHTAFRHPVLRRWSRDSLEVYRQWAAGDNPFRMQESPVYIASDGRFFRSEGATVDPWYVLDAYWFACHAAGVSFHLDDPLEEFLLEDGHCLGVRTGSQEITASTTVYCGSLRQLTWGNDASSHDPEHTPPPTGAQLGRQLESLGVRRCFRPFVQFHTPASATPGAVKAASEATQQVKAGLAPYSWASASHLESVPQAPAAAPLLDLDNHLEGRPTDQGQSFAISTTLWGDERAGEIDSWALINRLLERALKRWPGLEQAGLGDVAWFYESFSPDQLPVLGPSPALQGLYYATALGSYAAAVTPALARETAGDLYTRLQPDRLEHRPSSGTARPPAGDKHPTVPGSFAPSRFAPPGAAPLQ